MQSLWLALTNVIQGLHEPLLQLNSRAPPITYMAGQNLACSVCGKSNYSVPPFPHDGSNLTALQEALQEKKKKKKKKLGSGRSSDLLKQTEKPSQKGIQEEKRGKMNLQVLVEQIARTI